MVKLKTIKEILILTKEKDTRITIKFEHRIKKMKITTDNQISILYK